MAPQLQSLLDHARHGRALRRLEARGQDPDSFEAQRLHRSVRARLLDETVMETRIARFVVTHRLGVGGMGVVYAARDTELDRDVAIKLVRHAPAFDRDVDQQRLLVEARALAQLSHPNVVAIYDVGIHRGRVFIAMELVRGKTLRKWVQEPRSWQTIVDAYVQAAAGLAAAHRSGLVHRDFKPDNVLIDDATARVRVVDFGLAVGHDPDASERTPCPGAHESSSSLALTATGKVVGTPAYMAPEQLVGARADARSDQFAFCVALWEALFGERPFVTDRTLPRPRSAAAWVPRVPQHPERAPTWLRDVLARGLAFEPARRWPSMDALAIACRRPPRPWQRWLAGIAVAATAVGALLGAQAWTSARTQDGAMARSLAATEDSTRDPAREAKHLLATADAHAAAGSYADAEKQYERAYFVTAPRGLDQIAITAAIELVVVVGVRLERHDDGLAWARHAETLLDRIGDHTGADAAKLAQHTAGVLRQRGDFAAAKGAYERAIALRSAFAGAEDPAVATAMIDLASLHAEMLEIPEALALLENAERIVVAAHGRNALPLASVFNTRCTIEAKRGRYSDALPHCRRALEIREAMQAADHPDVASALSNLSTMLMATGDGEAGRTTLARAIEIRRARLGPTHPALAAALSNQGVNLSHIEDWSGAIAHLSEALDIRRATLPANHHDIATTLINLAEIELWRSRFSEAEALAAEAAAMMAANDDEIATIRGRALANVGMARLARDDHGAAIVALDEAVRTPYANVGDPAARCEVRFRLAEALLPSAPVRAVEAAMAAREPCTEGGPRTAEVLAAVDAILRGE